MIAFKFLQNGALALFTGHRWPLPAGDRPGEWVDASAPLALCSSGVHACSADGLTSWIDDELWVIELAGEIEQADDVFVAARGRLLRRVDRWGPATARAFAFDCVLRARDRAAAVLAATGAADAAAALDGGTDVRESQAAARALAGDGGAAGSAATLHLFADTVDLLDGGRPDGASLPRDAFDKPTEGAIAANLGYVVAHLFGVAAAGASGDAAGYDAGFAAERARQNAWLRDRLALAAPAE